MACGVGMHVHVCAGQSLNVSTLNQKQVLSSECLLSFCSECFLLSFCLFLSVVIVILAAEEKQHY